MLACLILSSAQGGDDRMRHSQLVEVPFDEVQVDDAFWNPYLDRIQRVTLPNLFETAEELGKIENFRIVAGLSQAKIQLYNAPDSDVYKLLEAAAYALQWRENRALERCCDELIALILEAQDESGYLHTQYMLPFEHPSSPSPDNPKVKTFGYGPEQRWKSKTHNWPFAYSQLYCAGHFMEAAVAYYRATDKRDLLDGAIRFANHIDEVFNREYTMTYADHPQVEIGLMKLYEVTGEERYVALAEDFSRYVRFSRPPDLDQEANSLPLHEQREAFGHAVRTAYIYTGATEVARAKGATDLALAMDRIWRNVTAHKMYLHGGTGNGTKAEQHGWNDELPILATYSESCAAIAHGQWNHSLNLLTGDAKYANLVELETYNNALASLSLDGNKFFYANKLNIGSENRQNEHSGVRRHYLFCCPSKVPGFVSGIGRWTYAKDDHALYVNQFLSSTVTTEIGGQTVSLSQKAGLPWGGQISMTLDQAPPQSLGIRIRVPTWVKGKTPIPNSPYSFEPDMAGAIVAKVNGEAADATIGTDGYLLLDRVWKSGDLIEVDFEMRVRRVSTDPRIKANRGRVALMRGPLLFSLESIDNAFELENFRLPPDSPVSARFDDDLLGGAVILIGKGEAGGKPVEFTAIPYFLWQNRGIGAMQTLLVEDPEAIQAEEIGDDEPVDTQG